MKRRKLLPIGLVTAGICSASLAVTSSALAESRTLLLTLTGGAHVTVTVDVPPGTPLAAIQVPPQSKPVIKVVDITPKPVVRSQTDGGPSGSSGPTGDHGTSDRPSGTTGTSGTTGAHGTTGDDGATGATGPSDATGRGGDGTPRADGPTGADGPSGKQGHKRGKRRSHANDGLVVGRARTRNKRPRHVSATPTKLAKRASDGRPTADDPSYSLALPGPAPVGVPNFFIEKFRIPPFLLPIYQAAGIQYGVPWQVLAAINEIETDYGRNLSVSTAGALGWMQFMPASWKQYGVDANEDGKKDPYNPVDAIFAAARYLKAAGAEQDLAKAIFAYNHADWYVESVLMRAKLIGGLPADLVGSLTGLTQGLFPVAAKASYADDLSEQAAAAKAADTGNAANPVDSSPARRGISIYSHVGAPVIAVNDGVIKRVGVSKRLGRYVVLQDVYGNTYTYGKLGKVESRYPEPKPETVSDAQVRRELELPKPDPAPSTPATAGKQVQTAPRPDAGAHAAADATADAPPPVTKERLFAHPRRTRSYHAGGADQVVADGGPVAGYTSFADYVHTVFGLEPSDVRMRRLEPGAHVVAGTVLGSVGKTDDGVAPRLYFEIRPTGRGAPRIDPKPILDGWKLLESTSAYRAAGKNPFVGQDAETPSIGQILLMSKGELQRRVLADPDIAIYACGRRDIQSGQIDRRVLATLEYLSASGLKPTVSMLKCGHSFMTVSGNVSEHSSGNAVDIAAVNGIPIVGHQGPGSITDITIHRLLQLQGALKPHQIISLMHVPGADNTIVMADHADHIHVGFRPLYGANAKLARQFDAVLKPGQWIKLIGRLNEIDNPIVPSTPSKYAIPDGTSTTTTK